VATPSLKLSKYQVSITMTKYCTLVYRDLTTNLDFWPEGAESDLTDITLQSPVRGRPPPVGVNPHPYPRQIQHCTHTIFAHTYSFILHSTSTSDLKRMLKVTRLNFNCMKMVMLRSCNEIVINWCALASEELTTTWTNGLSFVSRHLTWPISELTLDPRNLMTRDP